ncbi:MAG: 2'-deoxycytidine 5'-triphosphate deaminase [Myxococcota bacterium]|nr:2'-deoxycytidine 5'-triphosphate deaminase [Myxococcota bacterium]
MSNSRSRVKMSPGVLSKGQLTQLFEDEVISCNSFNRPDIDGSAFDLRLGENAWELTEGQRPTTRELAKLKANSNKIAPQTDKKGKYFQFDSKSIYLVELDHYLELPPNINGRATGKSSIGRLDVITRLLTDNNTEYDVVEAGYSGPLHLLVLPQTFQIQVKVGGSLNQLRLFSGPPTATVVSRRLIEDFGTPFWHILRHDQNNVPESWDSILKNIQSSTIADQTLFDLTVDLADPDFPYIFGAGQRDNSQPIDLRAGSGSHNPSEYFEKINIEKDAATRSVVLEQGRFYIMKSKERLAVPNDIAVEVIAISERIGDIRIHYAGFAHPGFGCHDGRSKPGTPLIFEVRATDMSTRLYDGSLLARIQLFRMSAETEIVQSAYDRQELKLSSVFKDWTD